MSKYFELFTKLRNNEIDFKPYIEKENNFHRLAIIHTIAALVVAPLFCLIVYNSDISDVYFYIGIGYTVMFPIYIGICWFIPFFNDKLIHFFILHLFGITFFAFVDLIEGNFRVVDLFSFFCLYSIVIFVIQRLYPCVVYVLFVIGLLIYGFQFIEDDLFISQNLIISFFVLLGSCAVLVLFSRERMINSVEDYNIYLRKLMQRSHFSYVLFRLDLSENKVFDYNQNIRDLFAIDSLLDLDDFFFSLFSESEMNKIFVLANDERFVKKFVNENDKTIEITINVLSLKNGFFWLARVADITNKILEKEELMMREEKYRNLYNKNQAGVFTLDKSTKLVDFNETFHQMFGSTFQVGDNFISHEHLDEWEELYEIISNKENLKNYQTHFTLKNGEVKWFVFNYFFDLKTGLIEGTVVDVTEVQKATTALSQSEEKYRMIYEESNDAILLLDGDVIIDVNRRGIQLFGKPEEELLETELWDLSFEKTEELARQYRKYKNKLEFSRNTKFNWVFRGNQQRIEAEVAIVELIIGENVFHQCVIQDVTEKNITIRALDKNRRSFQSILDNSPEGILIVKGKEVLYVNKEMYNLTDKETILFEDLFYNDDQQKFEELITEQKLDKKIHQYQLKLIKQNTLPVLVDVTLVSTTFAETDATLIILKDVTLQAKLTQEVMRAELAEESNKKLAKEIKDRIKAEKDLGNLLLKMKAIYDSSSNTLLITLNVHNIITYINSHTQEHFLKTVGKKIAVNANILEFLGGIFPDRELRDFNYILHQVKKGQSKQIESKLIVDGRTYWKEVFINPIYDTEGRVIEISMVAHDTTIKKLSEQEIVESLKEKEVLLKEIHHRVKNNLQVISSILNLQSSFVSDFKTLDLLQDSRNRIRSMAIIHENLYRTTNFSSIDFAGYIQNLAGNLNSLFNFNTSDIEIIYDLEQIDLVLDQAVPCGLLMNELITNALKYAFPNEPGGSVTILLKEENNIIFLGVTDNGVGLPQDFEIEKSDTLGLQLVLTLVEQLDGSLEYKNDNGTEFLIKFEKTKI